MANELQRKPPVNRLTDTAFRASGVFAKRVGGATEPPHSDHAGRLDLINAAVIRQSHLHLSVMLVATLGESTDWAHAAGSRAHRRLMLVNTDSYEITGVCCRRPLPFA